MRTYLVLLSLGLLLACPQPSRAAFVTQVLGDHPTGFWILDDANRIAVDSSMNAFNGTYEAGVTPQGIEGPSWVPSPGLVANFSGGLSGDISFTTPLDLGANGYTIEAWINPSDLDLIRTSRIVASGSGFNGYAFGTTDSGGLILTTFTQTDYTTTAVTLRPNEWQYVGVVLNVNSDVRFYVNGALVDTVGGLKPTITPTANFTIGDQSPGPGHTPEFFSGGLAGISVYDRPLTPSEIQAQFDSATAVPEPPSSLVVSGLVAFGAGCILRRRRRKTSSSVSH